MAKYRVHLSGYASMSTTVTVNDLDDEGKLLDEQDLRSRILEGEIDTPHLCHQCGGGFYGKTSLEIGDDWDWDDMAMEKISD